MIVLWVFFFLALFLEGVLTTLPFTLIFLLCLIIITKQEAMFLIAFIAGMLLDMLTFRPLGQSSIIFILMSFTVLMYERKYEIQSLPFILFATFFGSAIYLFIFSYPAIFWQAGLAALVAGVVFLFYRFITKPRLKKTYRSML